MKKFKIMKRNKIIVDGKTLYQIKALKDFSDVKKNDLGGYVESEWNLSQNIDNSSWIYDNAKAMDGSIVCGNATLKDNALVCDGVAIFGDAEISENAIIKDNSCVFHYVKLSGNVIVCDSAHISGQLELSGDEFITENMQIWYDKY